MHLGGDGGVSLSSAMFAEQDQRRVLQIAEDKKTRLPLGAYYISSTHAQAPHVFKYLKRAGRADFRVYPYRNVMTSINILR